MHDFVVVGCGPAGSRFARRAAEAGYDVLAFEQGEVGEPLACSGHVSTDVWEFTPDGARERLLQNVVHGARFHLGGPRGDPPGDPRSNGHAPRHRLADRDESNGADRAGEFPATSYPFYKDEQVSNVIDRVGLDRELADAAREAGVDLREHHTVVGVSEFRDRVEVEVRGPDGVETHEARMVAGCDGPKSRVRRELDMAEPDELLHGVLGFSDEDDDTDFVDVHLTVPEFFAWRIPRGEAGVEYGLATPPSADVRERFDRFTADYGVETDRRCSGLIPVGPPDSVTSRRAFLIGDAAAQTKPFTGGGIRYGMTAADHAARQIDPRDPATLSGYERAWRDDLEREIELGHWIRRAYSLPEPVQRVGLRAFSGEIGVHMDRPTSVFSVEQLKSMLRG
ncbi:geranylgeranyl reductase [Halosimplex carlsbadense 2-9-1]|uniref:Geranylgeranyl reductase n=1 Tax=Halosimplex carlsbadense 2-9-1 TaxID=797114 RepID=M0CUJ4_9EURY|nr:geranylgeranyl reductase family protein [Halosimplex carlsbadense]ELZ26915.1 geranylgeranyl reductase [Halosimplex carlsbadense 2-9-1]